MRKIPSEKEKEELRELVEELFNEQDFNFALACPENSWGGHRHQASEWECEHENWLCDNNITITSGYTRVVVIPEESDWVLKFNFDDEDFSQDFNRNELNNYQRAVEAGLDKYFAATYLLGIYCGTPTYIQERVRCDDDEISYSFYEYAKDNYCDEYDDDDDNEKTEEQIDEDAWDMSYQLDDEERIYAMIYDSHDAYELAQFCELNEINDIHSSNWGFRGNDAVLVDFAGF